MPRDFIRLNIEAERARTGMSRTDLCAKLHISAPTYRSWLRGGNIPSKKLLEMSTLFDCSTDYLLEQSKNTA